MHSAACRWQVYFEPWWVGGNLCLPFSRGWSKAGSFSASHTESFGGSNQLCLDGEARQNVWTFWKSIYSTKTHIGTFPPPPSSFVSAYMSSRLSCCYYSRPLPVCWSLYLLDCKAAPFTWRSPPMPRFYHGQVSFLTFSPPPNFSHCCILWSGSVFIVVIPKFRFCWPFQQLLLRHFGGIERAGTEWFRAPES